VFILNLFVEICIAQAQPVYGQPFVSGIGKTLICLFMYRIALL